MSMTGRPRLEPSERRTRRLQILLRPSEMERFRAKWRRVKDELGYDISEGVFARQSLLDTLDD